MPGPKENLVDTACFVDAKQAGNIVIRRSYSGIIIFNKNTPVLYISNRQKTIKSSTFESEFVGYVSLAMI